MNENTNNKFSFANEMMDKSELMLDYVKKNCVKAPTSVEEVAKELGIYTKDSLFNANESFSIENPVFKEMFKTSLEKIQAVFRGIPQFNPMYKTTFYEILHYRVNAAKIKE